MDKLFNKAFFRAWFVTLVFIVSQNGQALDLGWSAVSNLSLAGQSASNPRISISSDGSKATAVWIQSNGSNDIIQSRSATISGKTITWGAASNISANGQNANQPYISLSSDGSKAMVIWHHYNGANWVIQSRFATINGNTATWEATTGLSANGQNANQPHVSLSSNGNKAIAVWYRYNGSNHIVQSKSATISGNTATWSTVTNLSATGQSASDPESSISSDGSRATVVWDGWDGSNNMIQSRSRFIIGHLAGWTSVKNLSVAAAHVFYPHISLSSDGGRATVVWLRYNGSHDIVQSTSATISGKTVIWGAVSNLSTAGQSAGDPQVSLSVDGSKATAVWHHFNGSNHIALSKSATISGETAIWGPVTNLSTTERSATFPDISLSSDGSKTTVVWARRNDSDLILQSRSASINDTKAIWGTVTNLSAAGHSVLAKQISTSSDGYKAIVVWARYNGSNYIVQSALGIESSSCYVIKSSSGEIAIFCL